MSRRSKLPQMRFHKTTNQAYVRLDGKMVYLGTAKVGDVPATVRDRYDEVIQRWLAGKSVDSFSLTIDGLAIRYIEHACQHYRKNGHETSEVSSIRSALRMLIKVAGKSRVDKFGPLKLQEVRSQMIEAGWRRKNINQQVNRIRRAFRWGVSQELVQPEILAFLESVSGLRSGRSAAIESIPVTTVSDAAVEAVRPYVSRQVWAMIQLQRLTGMRPGEVLLMRGQDLNTTGRLWEYRPESHKTEHHGRDRVIVLGPKAQTIVREFLRPDLSDYLFSPVDARNAWNEKRRASRKSPMTPSQAARQSKTRPQWSPRERYDTQSYGTAIRRGCERAFAMPKELRNVSMQLPPTQRETLKEQARAWREANCWSPNQLRHTAATEIRREFGIEAAQNTLGHASVDVTEIYAEKSLDQVREVMEKLG